jgi:hypothetical protein
VAAFALASPAIPPSVAAMTENLFRQQASAARKLGEVHAVTLDHAVAEMKAGLGEIEELARASSLSEALLIQARAFRRGQEAWVSHIGALTRLAGKGAA